MLTVTENRRRSRRARSVRQKIRFQRSQPARRQLHPCIPLPHLRMLPSASSGIAPRERASLGVFRGGAAPFDAWARRAAGPSGAPHGGRRLVRVLLHNPLAQTRGLALGDAIRRVPHPPIGECQALPMRTPVAAPRLPAIPSRVAEASATGQRRTRPGAASVAGTATPWLSDRALSPTTPSPWAKRL